MKPTQTSDIYLWLQPSYNLHSADCWGKISLWYLLPSMMSMDSCWTVTDNIWNVKGSRFRICPNVLSFIWSWSKMGLKLKWGIPFLQELMFLSQWLYSCCSICKCWQSEHGLLIILSTTYVVRGVGSHQKDGLSTVLESPQHQRFVHCKEVRCRGSILRQFGRLA